MPMKLYGQAYYRTAEVCRMVGISRNILCRWLKEGVFSEAERRDREGSRLFTKYDIAGLKAELNRISKANGGLT